MQNLDGPTPAESLLLGLSILFSSLETRDATENAFLVPRVPKQTITWGFILLNIHAFESPFFLLKYFPSPRPSPAESFHWF